MNESHKYDDIINLPHHGSTSRPRMPIGDRAAQFSPFAALTGYEEAVSETARETDPKRELTDDEKNSINEKLRILGENIEISPSVSLTYFLPDKRKEGGKYVTKAGELKAIDSYTRRIVFTDKTTVDIDAVRGVSSPLFENYLFEL